MRLPEARRGLLYAAFFLSGFSTLIYQVIWVREFGNFFGNTLESAALVTGIFMLGLGVGSLAAGRWIDGRYAAAPSLPLRGYVTAESLIAAWGLSLALAFPLMEIVSTWASSYTQGHRLDPSWFVLSPWTRGFRLLLAALLVAPPTLFMGATLTLLVRHLVADDPSRSGPVVGRLYGINTLGSAAGAFAADTLLIPALGLWRTQLLAVLGNVAAAALAWSFFRFPGRRAAEAGTPSTGPSGGVVDLAGIPRLGLWLCVALFASGFAIMGFEILWLRYVGSTLGKWRAVFSLILCCVLLGIWLGSWVGGRISTRLRSPLSAFVSLQASSVVLALLLIAWLRFEIPADDTWPFLQAAVGRPLTFGIFLLLKCVLMIVPPVFLAGMLFPLANAILQRSPDEVGTTTGRLYLSNTLGAIAGVWLTGFLLIPGLGTRDTTLTLFAVGMAGALAVGRAFLFSQERQRAVRLRHGLALGIAALAVLAGTTFLALPAMHFYAWERSPGVESRVLARDQGSHHNLVVTETRDGSRTIRALHADGYEMSSTTAAKQRYQRLFVHLAMAQLDQPSRALVICFGIGNSLAAATTYDALREIHLVDVAPEVLAQARHFAVSNGDALRDPRTRVFLNDGRHHLRMLRGEPRYDLITLEPPPLSYAGVSSLYSVEFFELARAALEEGGILTQWYPLFGTGPDNLLSTLRSFTQVFPEAVLFQGSGAQFILAGRKNRPLQLDPDAWERVKAANPRARADLERIGMDSLLEFVTRFAADGDTLRRASADATLNTDDAPNLEYGILTLLSYRAPASIFHPGAVFGYCPACRTPGNGLLPGLEALPRRLELMRARYRDPAFLDMSE